MKRFFNKNRTCENLIYAILITALISCYSLPIIAVNNLNSIS